MAPGSGYAPGTITVRLAGFAKPLDSEHMPTMFRRVSPQALEEEAAMILAHLSPGSGT